MERMICELQDAYVDGHVDEVVLSTSLVEMGLVPHEVTDHLEQARNWRIMAALSSEWGNTKYENESGVSEGGYQRAA